MKKKLIAFLALTVSLLTGCSRPEGAGCCTGAFLADEPSASALRTFQTDYGKKPFLVMIFLDWGKLPAENVIRDVYGEGSVLIVTWEPWDAASKTGIDPDAILEGKYDGYIRELALRLKAIAKPVFMRFAHEMNGDWYPWSAQKIGWRQYQRIFKYVREVFDREGAMNVRWIFSINAEDVPKENSYALCYPGDRYVDYIGLDGYNWGTTQSWSKWRSFKEIFDPIYGDVLRRFQKPVLITEFSSASAGGDKARWIEGALAEIKKMKEIKGWVLFNIDKETDWFFPPASRAGAALKNGLKGPYFKESALENL